MTARRGRRRPREAGEEWEALPPRVIAMAKERPRGCSRIRWGMELGRRARAAAARALRRIGRG